MHCLKISVHDLMDENLGQGVFIVDVQAFELFAVELDFIVVEGKGVVAYLASLEGLNHFDLGKIQEVAGSFEGVVDGLVRQGMLMSHLDESLHGGNVVEKKIVVHCCKN